MLDRIGTPSTSSRRQPVVQARAIATRARILDQAAEAFAGAGYDAASLTGDILDPAGVSVGSFYHQFDNKLDVLFALIDEYLEEHADRIVGRAAGEPADPLPIALRRLLTDILDDVDRAPHLWWILVRERLHPDPRIADAVRAGWKPWCRVVDGLVGGHAPIATCDLAIATDALAGFLPALVSRYLHVDAADRPRWRQEAFPLMVDFFVGGATTLAGT